MIAMRMTIITVPSAARPSTLLFQKRIRPAAPGGVAAAPASLTSECMAAPFGPWPYMPLSQSRAGFSPAARRPSM